MAKKIIAWLLLIVLTAGIAIGGTLAYLTDRDSEANIFTTGDVDITLDETFDEDNALLMPTVPVNKDVQITNVGPNTAYVWYTYAVPAALAEYLEVTFADNTEWQTPVEVGKKTVVGDDGKEVEYMYYAVLHTDPVEANKTTAVSMDAVTLSGLVDVAPNGDLYAIQNGTTTPLNWNLNNDHIIYVDAYAIQVEGFDSVVKAYNAFQDQWGSTDKLTEVPTIKVNSADELNAAMNNPDLVPGTVIDATGVTVIIENNEQYHVPGGITLKNVTYISKSRGGDYMVINSGVGDKVIFENCIFKREDTGMLIIAGNGASSSDMEFNNCTFNGFIVPNYVEKADGQSVFNNCSFGLGAGSWGYVNCMGGTHTFNSCSFDYTGGATFGSNQYVKWNAVNSYSESYSTAVVLDGCTFTNCGTQRYGSNSTLIKK